MRPLEPNEELGKRVDIVVMRAAGKHSELIHEVIYPGPFRDEPAEWSRIWKVYVPCLDPRLRRLRAGELAALRLDGDDARHAVTKHVDDRGTVGRVFDQNRPGFRVFSLSALPPAGSSR